MHALADNRSLMLRRRGVTDGDNMKTNGCLVAREKRVEQNRGNLDPEIFVAEFDFAVAGEDTVGAERGMHRHGRRVRFAMQGQVAGDDRGAFVGASHDYTADAAALASDDREFIRLERLFGDVSIARSIAAAIAD